MPNKHVALRMISPEKPLYHYTKSNGIQGILKDRAFFATKSNFLNDTNEIHYTMQVAREVLEELPEEGWREALKREFSEFEEKITNQSFYLTSFSVDPDSITLWSEFGDKTGYNLEFNSGELLERIGSQRKIRYHGFLIYSGTEQRRKLRELLTTKIPETLGASYGEIQEAALADPKVELFRKYCRYFHKAVSVYALFFKQEEFAAEQEYRLVFKEKNPQEILFREKDGFLMPYITVGLGEGKGLIRRIRVAPKNHVDLARAGMKMFAEHYGYEVEVCLSRIHLRY